MHPTPRPSSNAAADAALRAYLAMIVGGAPDSEFLEIRFRVTGQALANEFHPVWDTDAVIESIRRRSPRTDVYLGCAPRTRRQGTKDAVGQVWTLWAECDGEEAARRLRRFRPRPALVVASGSGLNCHGYWPLASPLSPRLAEAANLRLVHALAADRNCFDAGRILRPPGTWNHKRQPPRPVAVVHLRSELRFAVGEVLSGAPEVDASLVDRRWQPSERRVRDDPLLAISPRVYVADLTGHRVGRDGKVACPFHTDRRASLHAYPTGERGWCCFSCRRAGTIYDLAAAMWGLQTRGRDFVRLRERLLERYARELPRARENEIGR